MIRSYINPSADRERRKTLLSLDASMYTLFQVKQPNRMEHRDVDIHSVDELLHCSDRTERSYPRAKESIRRTFYLVDRSNSRKKRTPMLTQPKNNKRCGSRTARRREKQQTMNLINVFVWWKIEEKTDSIDHWSINENQQTNFFPTIWSFFLSFSLVFFFSLSLSR